ncbi:hypothetical protein DsansV1_C04g0046241 [Dioscorea sansibarensis]
MKGTSAVLLLEVYMNIIEERLSDALRHVLEAKRAKFDDFIATIKRSLKFMGPHIDIAGMSDTAKEALPMTQTKSFTTLH